VCIDSTLVEGSLTYAECVLPGASDDEVLFSTHICHPSLANDNLSGIAVATALAAQLAALPERRYTYRFLFIPGTIGSITWLARNEDAASRVRHGLVITGLGDPGDSTYKRSRQDTAPIDRIVAYVLKQRGAHHIALFSPYGYDERQFCSPGFNLPMGCLTRSTYGSYPEYHTSGDTLDFVREDKLADSLEKLLDVIEILEQDGVYVNLNPKCEPQLGKRGLYGALGGASDAQQLQMALLWVLNQSDGEHSLLDIAERAGIPFDLVHRAAWLLQTHRLLRLAG
jgi:aminopeptidase-like protein